MNGLASSEGMGCTLNQNQLYPHCKNYSPGGIYTFRRKSKGIRKNVPPQVYWLSVSVPLGLQGEQILGGQLLALLETVHHILGDLLLGLLLAVLADTTVATT